MNRFLQWFNFLGVLALAVLCTLQWQANRLLNLKAVGLEKTRLEQVARLADQDKQIKGQAADLDDFRQRLTLAESQLKELQDKLTAMTRERNQLGAERDQLKASVEAWHAAVAARDTELKKTGERIQQLAADRNDAVAKFNDLANKYNALVNEAGAGKTK